MLIFTYGFLFCCVAQAAGICWAVWKRDDAKYEADHARWVLAWRDDQLRTTWDDLGHAEDKIRALEAEIEALRHAAEGRGTA
jgi:hypothetical protein